jgi:phage shock protein B
MMSMWTAIALISVAGILAGIFRDRGKRHHSEELTDELRAIHSKLDALENELRERVETLERIVTNPKEDLKRQFDHLDKAC